MIPHFYLNLSKNLGSNVLLDFVSINPLFHAPIQWIYLNILQIKKINILHRSEIKSQALNLRLNPKYRKYEFKCTVPTYQTMPINTSNSIKTNKPAFFCAAAELDCFEA